MLRANGTASVALSLLMLAGLAIGSSVAPADAETYFALTSTGGVINPGVYVGFNPQPDPPGVPPTTLSMDVPTDPLLTAYPPGPCDTACTYRVVMSFSDVGNVTLPAVQTPTQFGVSNGEVFSSFADMTAFRFTALDNNANSHTFDVTLYITGPSNVSSWGAFNPQPDPPGFGFGYQFGLVGDPDFDFTICEDGSDAECTGGQFLSFQSATPLPAALPLFASGIGAMGLFGWRRKRKAAPIGS
jgi:hypothetical protein